MAERWHPDEDLVLDAVLGTGDQRDDVVAHLASCTRCRRAHGALVDAVDLVLPAVPRTQPPTGFESRVLERLGELRPAGARSRPRRWPSVLAAAAAGLLGVGVGAAGVGLLTGDPAEEPPAVVSAPAVPLVTADGADVGTVSRMRDEGGPRIVVVVEGTGSPRTYTCRVRLADGTVQDVGTWPLAEHGERAWVVDEPAPGVRSVELVGQSGAVWATAEM